jgi:uncharacterized protein involved in response to NO
MTSRAAARPYPAFKLLFPAATVFAAVAVPVWVLAYAGLWPLPVLDLDSLGHGHEMVFGYALAVVGGFLFTRVTRAQAIIAFVAWLCGRVVFVFADTPASVATVASLAFPAFLFWLGGRPWLRAAKTADNAVFGLVVGAFFIAELLYQSGAADLVEDGQRRGLVLGVDLIALLLLAMGGRVIAAATSGAIQRKGGHIVGVAQPRAERAAVLALVAMTVLDLLAWLPEIAGALALLAGLVVFLRLIKWRFWTVLDVSDVACLHLGYAWLGIGLLVKAAAQILGEPAMPDAIHGIAIGALGTLTVVMMTRTTLQRGRRPLAMPPTTVAAVALISAAAVLRLLASFTDVRLIALEASAALWTAGFLVFALFLFPALLARR